MATKSKVNPVSNPLRDEPRLDAFCNGVRAANPFRSNRITEPSPYDVDVTAIHAASFDRLVSLAGQALHERAGIGAVLFGGAGVGKSHLLSRLYRWASEPTADGGTRACYVYLQNILADPDRLPRYVLKYVVSRLSMGGSVPLYETPLFRFVENAIRHSLAASGVVSDKLSDGLDAYRNHFGRTTLNRATYDVLFQFLRHARPEKSADPTRRYLASAAVAWLSGDEIDPEAARQLGLKVEGNVPAMLRDDHEVEQVFLALTQFAIVSNQPFILCLDQVENLEPDNFKPLARFLHALLDHASNLFIIVSGVKQTLLDYRDLGAIPEASWDRIAQFRIELARVNPAEARKILEARLERFLEPFTEQESIRRIVHQDTLFPLGLPWLQNQLGEDLEFRARDVLTWARDRWDEQQKSLGLMGSVQWFNQWEVIKDNSRKAPDHELSREEIEAEIDTTVDQKVKEHIAQHRLAPGSLPPDAGNMAGLVATLLGHCLGDGLPYTVRKVERTKKKGGKLPPYDLLVREKREGDGKEVTTGVLFITNVGLSATAALRRLLEDPAPPDHRLLVTDQERRPLKVGAQGVEYYRDLEKLGPDRFEHLKLNFEQYLALDALSGVVNMAHRGDLEIEVPRGTIRPVTKAEVIASHHRQDRYRHHPLIRPLLTEEPGPKVVEVRQTKAQVNEKDARSFIMAQLALMMGTTASALTKSYVEVMPVPKMPFEPAWPQLKSIVERMHNEGLVHAMPTDDDLWVIPRK